MLQLKGTRRQALDLRAKHVEAVLARRWMKVHDIALRQKWNGGEQRVKGDNMSGIKGETRHAYMTLHPVTTREWESHVRETGCPEPEKCPRLITVGA